MPPDHCQFPPPPDEIHLAGPVENSPGRLSIRTKGCRRPALLWLMAAAAPVSMLSLIHFMESASGHRLATGIVLGLSTACLVGSLLQVIIAREKITATPDGLDLVRWSLFGPRYWHLGGKPEALWEQVSSSLNRREPISVIVVEGGGQRVTLGRSLGFRAKAWLKARLGLMWSLDPESRNMPEEPPREAR